MKLDRCGLVSQVLSLLAVLAMIAVLSHAYWAYPAFELYLDTKRINQLSLACTDKDLEQLERERKELLDKLIKEFEEEISDQDMKNDSQN